jgi:hypothetical protein
MRVRIASLFFALGACSWMPHWACHYYRLETGSSFIVGSWTFSPAESVGALVVYSALILANLLAVEVQAMRAPVGVVSGTLHVGFAVLHLWRLASPFAFVVFGYSWSTRASLRESVIVGAFGIASIAMGLVTRTATRPAHRL